ncbi:MAG: hypothetical protein OQJ98_02820 [Candidatus Pacebacteria bacterium]|nr:hypothetical protein [Candidatus Paceibacterota bacterium]
MKYMPDDKTLELEVNEAIEMIVQNGLHIPKRASMLMAYGVNASNLFADINHQLPGFIQLIDVPKNLSPNDREHLKTDFRNWCIGNGFRELIEGIEAFLNSLFQIIAPTDLYFKGKSSEKAKGAIEKFERFGVWDKLTHLEKRYGFRTEMGHYFESLTQARNCLTHRNGIVGEKDTKKKGYLELEWLGIDIRIEESDGTEHIITLDTLGPIESSKFNTQDNAKMHCTYVNRSLKFNNGDFLEVPPRSLQEICSMSIYTIAKLHQLIMNWLLEYGIHLNNGMPLNDPKAQMLLEAEWPENFRE